MLVENGDIRHWLTETTKAMLLDARAEYKLRRKIRLRLEMNNLLNKKNYCYTVYSGLNSYNYDYLLRGREFLISFICMP